MNKLFALLLLGLFACGSFNDGIVDDGTADEDSEEVDLGQTKEAIQVANGGYGFTNAASQLRCAQPGVSGQVCFASAVKVNATYCFTGSPALTNTDKAVIDQQMQLVTSQTGGNWHLAMGSFPCDIVFQQSTDQSGSTSANIENFMTATPSTLVSLTSPAGSGHINGTWTSFSKLTVTLKLVKLSIVAAPPQAQSVLKHMAGHAAALYMALGTQQQAAADGPGIQSWTRRVVDLNNTIGIPFSLTPGEKCRAQFQGLGTPTTLVNTFSCPAF